MKYSQYTQKDFSWAKMSVQEIKSFPKIAAENIKARIKIIQGIKKENRNFQNTIFAFENANEEEMVLAHKVHTLSMVSDKKEIRDAARLVEVEISNLSTDIAYDIKTFNAISDYYDHNYILEKKESILDDQDIKLVEDIMRGYKRMGFDLPLKDRNKIKSIEKKISKLTSKYDEHLAENNDYILCNEEEMEGVPQNVKNSFTKIKDKYKITLEYPEYGPYIKYAKNREKRLEIYKKFMNSGGEKNVKILKELISLRKEKSRILGYAHHADYVTEDRMAKSVKAPYKMLDTVLKELKSRTKIEVGEVKEKAKADGVKEFRLSDMDYYVNKIREEKYAYDEQVVREYFPLNHVLNSMFELFGNLFGFNIVQSEIKLWHKDAKLFEIHDKKSKQIIAYIALDLFPREGKFGHACMMPIISGKELILEKSKELVYESPFAALICNFSKASKNTPSLLTLGEVETLYHEFGHGLHGLLTKAKYTSHSGTSVVWDFVETPSQLLEEWVTEEKVLAKISKHYITSKPLPINIIQKIQDLKKFMQGTHYTRQSVQSLLDLDLYTEKVSDPVKHYHHLMNIYIHEQRDDIIFVGKFAHIARGYDAGYYSYMWAEGISKDIYSEFKKVGIFDKKLGEKYRKEILEVGGSRDEEQSVKNFLGRDINYGALVESIK
jgi:Zn-dependent oligopeptidase